MRQQFFKIAIPLYEDSVMLLRKYDGTLSYFKLEKFDECTLEMWIQVNLLKKIEIKIKEGRQSSFMRFLDGGSGSLNEVFLCKIEGSLVFSPSSQFNEGVWVNEKNVMLYEQEIENGAKKIIERLHRHGRISWDIYIPKSVPSKKISKP